MEELSPEAKQFLHELYSATEGDPDRQLSMYDVGAALGLERDSASALAQDLIIEEFADLKSLAGSISITAKGLVALNITSGTSAQAGMAPLGNGPFLNEQDQQKVTELIAAIRLKNPQDKSIGLLEEIVFDLKTLEVQLLSPRPRTAVVKALLAVLSQPLQDAGLGAEADTAAALIR